MVERERCRFGQGEEEGGVFCENEVEWKGIYKERGSVYSAIQGGNGWENGFEFLKVGGVYGEEWMDVSGEGGDWEEELR